MKIIAELGASHNGSFERTRELLLAAKQSGADEIKFQCWTFDSMDMGGRTLDAGPWKGRTLQNLYRKAFMPWQWFKPLIAEAAELGLGWHSSVFDQGALAFLEGLGCPAYKIASFELVDIPLIRDVEKTGKPIVLSTGMATKAEVDRAVGACGDSPLTLLKCVSAYPAHAEDYNLHTLPAMMQEYQCDGGLSDHTRSVIAPVMATALGAVQIERHLKLPGCEGLDSGFASSPDEFGNMVEAVREACRAAGEVKYGPTPSESPSLSLRRSLWVARPIRKGQRLGPGDLVTARPGDGVSPVDLGRLMGQPIGMNLSPGMPMKWAYLA